VVVILNHKAPVRGLAFSPSGTQLATTCTDKSVRLWDVTASQTIARTPLASELERLSFSKDGKTLAVEGYTITGQTRSVWLLNANDLSRRADAQVRDCGFLLALSPDGKRFASSTGDFQTIKVCDCSNGQLVWSRPRWDTVNDAAYSPKSFQLLAVIGAKTLAVFDSIGKQLASSDELHGHNSSLAFSPDGKLLASGASEKVSVWQAATLKRLLLLTGHKGAVNQVIFSPNGQVLASASIESLRLWDLAGKELYNLTGHTADIRQAAFSPDGNLLASCAYDRTVRLWDTNTGKVRAVLRGHTEVGILQFSPDGRLLASGGEDGTVRLWNVAAALDSSH
jgi:WD40 repeat protein